MRKSEKISALIAACLNGDQEERQNSLQILHFMEDGDVATAISKLERSESPSSRVLAADIAAQWKGDREQCLGLLDRLLDDSDANVVAAAATAFMHRKSDAVVGRLVNLAQSPEPVRSSVASALAMNYSHPESVLALQRLKQDPVDEVRQWVAIGLGFALLAGQEDVSEDLLGMCTDRDDETRGEALLALAEAGDVRVLPLVILELAASSNPSWAIDAARFLADKRLCEPLNSVRSKVTGNERWMKAHADAVAACCTGD